MIQNIPLERVLFLDIERFRRQPPGRSCLKRNSISGIKKQNFREKMRSLQKIFMTGPVLWLSSEKSSVSLSEWLKRMIR